MKVTNSFNIQIWVGLREGYGENINTIEDVRNICKNYVNEIKDCITITPTEYIYVDGTEPGVIIGYINYPRFPRTSKELKRRAFGLAKILLKDLNQNRISITTKNKTYMLEK